MAKKEYLNEKKLQQELFKRTEGYAYSVRAHYMDAFNQVINLVKGTELEAGKPFSFSEYGYSEQVTPIFREMYSRVYQTIRGGVQAEWLNSNEHTDDLVKAVFGASSIEDHHFARYFKRNQEAMDAFFARKSADGGLNLSQRVWKYNGEFKEELENTLDLAIGEGTPAMQLASKVKEYLNDPDRWYRRFRYKIGEDENGKPIYGLKWKRRIWDNETGTYKWIDAKPTKYHPGEGRPGVYRSSARNAQRLARTETNIAYRTADYERWQQLDFVIGMRVRLSNNHPVTDICDLMADKLFPKDFKWTGWHPNCRCYMEPVLATEEDLDKMLDNILDGKEPTENLKLEGEVKKMPEEFGDWIKANEERMEAARERGTLPYFVRDNESLVAAALSGDVQGAEPTILERAAERHKARTSEEIERIRKAWETRKEAISLGDSVLSDLNGISDVDTTDLQNQLNTAHYTQALEEARRLQQIVEQLKTLEFVDDGLALAKQYGYEAITDVEAAVKAKLEALSVLPLEKQKSKLEFEVYKYFGGNMNGCQQKYKTWQVAQNAYAKQLKIVNDKLWWQDVKAKQLDFLSYSTKSAPYKDLLLKLDQAIQAQDKQATNQALAKLEYKKQQLEVAAGKRAAKKGAISDPYDYSLRFKSSDFSKARKDGAVWTTDRDYCDSICRSQTQDLWSNADEATKRAATAYTEGSGRFNRPLRGYEGSWSNYKGVGNVSLNYEGAEQDIKMLTDLIGQTSSPKDMWMNRGVETLSGVSNFLGVSESQLRAAISSGNVNGFVGKEIVDHGFVSCGTAKGTGFSGTTLNIYCPKGTKMIYAEPFSRYNGDSCSSWNMWNGTEKYSFGHEFETIIQRGTKFRVTKAYVEYGHLYLDVEVIAQI